MLSLKQFFFFCIGPLLCMGPLAIALLALTLEPALVMRILVKCTYYLERMKRRTWRKPIYTNINNIDN